jgi:hypothetical protein
VVVISVTAGGTLSILECCSMSAVLGLPNALWETKPGCCTAEGSSVDEGDEREVFGATASIKTTRLSIKLLKYRCA